MARRGLWSGTTRRGDRFERATARTEVIQRVRYCLTHHFHVPAEGATPEDFPALTLLLSILDLSISRNRPFPASKMYPSGLSREYLVNARTSLEYIIFAVLDHYLAKAAGSAQSDLLWSPLSDGERGPQVISLNYDLLSDTALCKLSQTRVGPESRIDYCLDVRTKAYEQRTRTYGKLLKLHGSLNWMYCPGCNALQVGMSNGPHINRVWYEAEKLLRRTRKAYIVGYSLPDDDLEVIHLLRRGLEGIRGEDVTVITLGDDQARKRRYRSLFGEVNWETRASKSG